jgi:small membrane protein
MVIFQILFILFSLFALGNVFRRKLEGLLSIVDAIFWSGFWILADIVVLKPDNTTVFANKLGIGRGADLIVYVALALIFFVLFRLHVKLHEIERDVTTVVRKKALEEIEK